MFGQKLHSSLPLGTPNEIVPRRGPPSVDYEESDKKVNQSSGQLIEHKKGTHALKPSSSTA